jgi:hypothetical protein
MRTVASKWVFTAMAHSMKHWATIVNIIPITANSAFIWLHSYRTESSPAIIANAILNRRQNIKNSLSKGLVSSLTNFPRSLSRYHQDCKNPRIDPIDFSGENEQNSELNKNHTKGSYDPLFAVSIKFFGRIFYNIRCCGSHDNLLLCTVVYEIYKHRIDLIVLPFPKEIF